eukprot:1386764-Amorphochlora_amoeboformis.AAC.1
MHIYIVYNTYTQYVLTGSFEAGGRHPCPENALSLAVETTPLPLHRCQTRHLGFGLGLGKDQIIQTAVWVRVSLERIGIWKKLYKLGVVPYVILPESEDTSEKSSHLRIRDGIT